MADADRLILQVLPVADSDAEELADLRGDYVPSCSLLMRTRLLLCCGRCPGGG